MASVLCALCVQITPEYKLAIPKLPSPSGEKERKESGKKSAHYDQRSLENEKQLSPSTLCLPVCRISESVQQLMDLAIQTLSEAVGSSPQWYVAGSQYNLAQICFRVHVKVVIAELHIFGLFLSVQSSFSTQFETFFTSSMMLCLHITSKLVYFY